MCGRYTLTIDAAVLADFFAIGEVPVLVPRYNIAPTQAVPVVRIDAEGRRLWSEVRWGLIPFWAKDTRIGARMINARAETVADKPAFRTAFHRRRCLIPADGFIEWKKEAGGKQPHLIRFADGRPFAFAGIWEQWRPADGDALESCAIITTGANDLVAAVHDRMPVILPPDTHSRWLGPTASQESGLTELLVPHAGDEMEAVAVNPRVNSPANDDPECLQPMENRKLW
jgi:putative SOS response-associated peptidase YedK